MQSQMQFESASLSIVRSIKQRDLLNAWLRAFDKRAALPRREEYRPDRMGVGFKPVPETVIKAVIDQSVAVKLSRTTVADDLVELD